MKATLKEIAPGFLGVSVTGRAAAANGQTVEFTADVSLFGSVDFESATVEGQPFHPLPGREVEMEREARRLGSEKIGQFKAGLF